MKDKNNLLHGNYAIILEKTMSNKQWQFMQKSTSSLMLINLVC